NTSALVHPSRLVSIASTHAVGQPFSYRNFQSTYLDLVKIHSDSVRFKAHFWPARKMKRERLRDPLSWVRFRRRYDCALLLEGADLALVEAIFAQHVSRMFAVTRRTRTHLSRRPGKFDRKPERLHWSKCRVFDLDDHLARD